MIAGNYLFLVLLVAGMVLSALARKLTVTAAIIGGIVGALVFAGGGYTGFAMLGTFFIAGSFATSWQYKHKQQLGIAEANKGARTVGQVLANGGVAALTGLISLYDDRLIPATLLIAGSLAAATADTLSSELGSVYGRRFYNVVTFKPDKRGLDGVISLEGTLAGVAGAVVIALVYTIGTGDAGHMMYLIIAGIVGNYADSVLGATLERKRLIGNNTVNMINTLTGAAVVLLCWMLCG